MRQMPDESRRAARVAPAPIPAYRPVQRALRSICLAELPRRGFLVISAGLAAMMGGAAADEAVEAARTYGADLGGHISRPLTPDLAAQAQRVAEAATALSLNQAVYKALASVDAAQADPATQHYAERTLLQYRLAGVDKDHLGETVVSGTAYQWYILSRLGLTFHVEDAGRLLEEWPALPGSA